MKNPLKVSLALIINKMGIAADKALSNISVDKVLVDDEFLSCQKQPYGINVSRDFVNHLIDTIQSLTKVTGDGSIYI